MHLLQHSRSILLTETVLLKSLKLFQTGMCCALSRITAEILPLTAFSDTIASRSQQSPFRLCSLRVRKFVKGCFRSIQKYADINLSICKDRKKCSLNRIFIFLCGMWNCELFLCGMWTCEHQILDLAFISTEFMAWLVQFRLAFWNLDSRV